MMSQVESVVFGRDYAVEKGEYFAIGVGHHRAMEHLQAENYGKDFHH